MSTKTLLKDCTEIRDRLFAEGPSDELLFEHHCLNEAMQHFRLRLEYERARIAFAIHREFSDSEPPLTELDIEYLSEAADVNQKITELLRGRKGGRAKRAAS